MKKLLIGLLVFGLATQFMFSQTEELPEVRLDVNYKYLDATTSELTPEQVKILEKQVAYYNLEEYDFYGDEFVGTYKVDFEIPEGKIAAVYDKNGKIIQTIERFRNVQLPRSVVESVGLNYPNWRIVQDWYRVNYFDKWGVTLKEYKLKLKKDGETMTVKINGNNEYL